MGMQLAEEQESVRQRYGDELDIRALNAMPYALSTVKEVMRVLPTTAGVFRCQLALHMPTNEEYEMVQHLLAYASFSSTNLLLILLR